jgi:uncharacterized DUF497 family protein
MDLEFEWDPPKAAANAQKHGVTFSEAATLFGDRWRASSGIRLTR